MNNLAERIEPADNPFDNQQFLQDVLADLGQMPKTLPCKYFYDEAGSALFEKICDLDEYYITRTELEILRSAGDEIASLVGEGATIVEPGSGAGIKVQVLLKALFKPKKFIPLEISLDALRASANALQQKFPRLEVIPHRGDFTDQKDLQNLPLVSDQTERRLVFFPGSTIGNFTRDQAAEVMQNLRILAGENGLLLLGADLIKDRQRLISAYDDAKGVTAEFNKNLLVRINRELNANFDYHQGFQHRAVFNEALSRIEMHLVATADQQVSIAGEKIDFAEGETIHTENSHKYSPEIIAQLANNSGFEVTHQWSDKQQDFGLFLLKPCA